MKAIPGLTTLSGRSVSCLGLGCSRLGSFNNHVSARDQEACVTEAVTLGINLFDTADVYAQGDSERTLGRLLRDRRDDIFLVTKIGKRFSGKMRMMRPLKPILKPLISIMGGGEAVTRQRSANISGDFTPERFAAALKSSLTRLRFDCVDGLLLHSPPGTAIGDPAVAEALTELVDEGKIRSFGISCDDMEALDAALQMPGLGLLELPVDLIEACEGTGRLDHARASGVAVLGREVIRCRPDLAPLEAVRRAVSHVDIDAVVVGVSSVQRLRQLVEAVGSAPC